MRASPLLSAGLLALVGGALGCFSPARGFCEASADCDQELFGFAIYAAGDSDDDVAVCTAEQDAPVEATPPTINPSAVVSLLEAPPTAWRALRPVAL